MSDGLQEWKAPLQMNRMWSVLTLPYLVETTDPSMMGSRSLWTPSEEASAPEQLAQSWLGSFKNENKADLLKGSELHKEAFAPKQFCTQLVTNFLQFWEQAML